MSFDRVSLGRIPLVLRYIVPALGFSARRGMRRKRAADGKHVGGCRDVSRADRRRLLRWQRQPVLFQTLERGYRELGLGIRSAIDGAVRQAALSGNFVE